MRLIPSYMELSCCCEIQYWDNDILLFLTFSIRLIVSSWSGPIIVYDLSWSLEWFAYKSLSIYVRLQTYTVLVKISHCKLSKRNCMHREKRLRVKVLLLCVWYMTNLQFVIYLHYKFDQRKLRFSIVLRRTDTQTDKQQTYWQTDSRTDE